jgi:CheY-like chemotaxis protein
MFEHVHDMYIHVDATSRRIDFANQAARVAYAIPRAGCAHLDLTLPASIRCAHHTHVSRFLTTSDGLERTHAMSTFIYNGRTLHSSLVRTSSGTLVILRDQEPTPKAQTQQHMVSCFHDARNRLHGICNLTVLSSMASDDKRLMLSIVNAIESDLSASVDFYKISRRMYTPIYAKIPAKILLTSCGYMAQASLAEAGIEMDMTGVHSSVTIVADPYLCKSLITNIINNCCRHSGATLLYWTGETRSDGSVQICAIDDGKGVPIPLKVGIGLSLCTSITNMFGGSLDVRRTANVSGTECRIWLPNSQEISGEWMDFEPPKHASPSTERRDIIIDGSMETKRSELLEPTTLQPTARNLVMLVEDEPVSRKLFARFAGRRGWRVIVANDGEAGVERFREYRERIAVIVTDLWMPKMDGLSMLDAIGKEALGGILVILQTATAEQGRKHRLVDTVFRKPVQLMELAGAVETRIHV